MEVIIGRLPKGRGSSIFLLSPQLEKALLLLPPPSTVVILWPSEPSPSFFLTTSIAFVLSLAFFPKANLIFSLRKNPGPRLKQK